MEFVATITPTQAAHVLWHFSIIPPGPPAMEPGSFTKRLLEAIAAADPVNRYKLALGFTGYVAAMTLAQETDGGMDELRRIASELATT